MQDGATPGMGSQPFRVGIESNFDGISEDPHPMVVLHLVRIAVVFSDAGRITLVAILTTPFRKSYRNY